MSFNVELGNLSVHFGDTRAVDELSVAIPAGRITGLLGRNGAGKTTLMATVAGYRRPTSGTVNVDGEDPYENPRVVSGICLVRDGSDLDQSMKVDEVFELIPTLRGGWDQDLADRLIERFGIPLGVKIGALSRGMSSALSATIGLASRAPLTMFDEPQLGMDPTVRYAFYEELLTDYALHPRTIILSTHLIEEAASLFEAVLIIDRGRLLLHESVDDLVGRGAELTGPAEAVDQATLGMTVVHERMLGRTKSVVVLEPVSDAARAAAVRGGVDVGPLPLQDLFVHLTSELSQG